MGYSNIPFAVGWGLGNFISGYLYESLGSKVHFARQYLVETAGMAAAEVKDLPLEKAMAAMAATLNGGKGGTVEEATHLLWQAHHPWIVWVILGAVGLVATVAMMGYYLKTKDRGISSAAASAAASSESAD